MRDSAVPLKATVLPLCLVGLALNAGCLEDKPVSKFSERETIVRTAKKGDVELTVAVSPKEPRLSDLVEMEVKVSYPNSMMIEPPVFGQSVGDFAVREYGERTAKSDGKKQEPSATEYRTFRYQLEPMFSGRHLIRSIPIVFSARENASDTRDIVQSEPIEVDVRSNLGDEQPDLASVDPMIDPMALKRIGATTWVVGILSLVVLGGLAIWFVRSRRKPIAEEPPLPPDMIASLELDRLIQEDLPRQGRVKEFYLRLTGIVRQYIEGTTGLRAPEQTTEEFLREARQSDRFDPAQAVRLQDFLEAADMVKYAGQQPNQENISHSISRAQGFIRTRFARMDSDTATSVVAGDRS